MPFYYRPSRTVFPRRNLGAGSPDQDKNKWEHTSAQTLYYCYSVFVCNIEYSTGKGVATLYSIAG